MSGLTSIAELYHGSGRFDHSWLLSRLLSGHFRQQFLMKPAGVFNWQRGDALAIAEHFFLQASELDDFGRREGGVIELAVNEVATAVVLGVGPSAGGPVRRR